MYSFLDDLVCDVKAQHYSHSVGRGDFSLASGCPLPGNIETDTFFDEHLGSDCVRVELGARKRLHLKFEQLTLSMLDGQRRAITVIPFDTAAREATKVLDDIADPREPTEEDTDARTDAHRQDP